MTLKTTFRTIVSLATIAGLAMSGPALAGPCDSADVYKDRAVNEADAIALSTAILTYASGDTDYNDDGRVNVRDIVAAQSDARADVKDFGQDVISCITGGFDLNEDGVTNILDVVSADSVEEKRVISQCVTASGELDFNEDGTINVLDTVRYSMERNAEARGYVLATLAEIQGDISRLDLNKDGEVNVLDAISLSQKAAFCK